MLVRSRSSIYRISIRTPCNLRRWLQAITTPRGVAMHSISRNQSRKFLTIVKELNTKLPFHCWILITVNKEVSGDWILHEHASACGVAMHRSKSQTQAEKRIHQGSSCGHPNPPSPSIDKKTLDTMKFALPTMKLWAVAFHQIAAVIVGF